MFILSSILLAFLVRGQMLYYIILVSLRFQGSAVGGDGANGSPLSGNGSASYRHCHEFQLNGDRHTHTHKRLLVALAMRF